MAKVKAEVLNAVVGRKRCGETVELNEATADRLERIGYVKVTGQAKQKQTKKTQTKQQPKQKKETAEEKTDKDAQQQS